MNGSHNLVYEYGIGHNDIHAMNVDPYDLWLGRSDFMKSMCNNYYKVAISKIRVYFKNFTLQDYAVKYHAPQEFTKASVKNQPKLNALLDFKADKDATLVDVNAEVDSTRRIMYFKDTSGLMANTVSNELNHIEHVKVIPLRKNLVIKDTIYCKPKKYFLTSKWNDLKDAMMKTLLSEMDVPDQVKNIRYYFSPVAQADLPGADNKQAYYVRYLTFDVFAYVTFTFAGINAESHV